MPKRKPAPAVERVRGLFDYRDGALYRRLHHPRWPAGSRSGTYQADRRYRLIFVDGVQYMEHRIVWLWHHGTWPDYVDHIDRDKHNNRIENLRAISNSENCAGVLRPRAPGNYSIRKGADGKWRLWQKLGTFDSHAEAWAALD